MANFNIRRDTLENFEASNPILAPNEIGVYLDVRNGVPTGTDKAKMGDGRTRFNDLDYWSPNGVTAPPYLVYTALLTQTGTSAPVATVLQNTVGEIVWTRNDVGQYIGTLAATFGGTTAIFLSNNKTPSTEDDIAYTFVAQVSDTSTIEVYTAALELPGGAVTLTDGLLTATSIEIKIY